MTLIAANYAGEEGIGCRGETLWLSLSVLSDGDARVNGGCLNVNAPGVASAVVIGSALRYLT